MNAPKIPGWELITAEGVQYCPTAQYVNGHWYQAANGRDSLKMLVDEWMESLWTAYGFCTIERKDGSRYGHISNGAEAIEKLKEFDLLDDEGRVIEG